MREEEDVEVLIVEERDPTYAKMIHTEDAVGTVCVLPTVADALLPEPCPSQIITV